MPSTFSLRNMGCFPVDRIIEPYNLTLNTMRLAERKAWAERVLRELRKVSDLERDRFTVLAGARYREHLVPHLSRAEAPLAGLPIGKQLAFLKREIGD